MLRVPIAQRHPLSGRQMHNLLCRVDRLSWYTQGVAELHATPTLYTQRPQLRSSGTPVRRATWLTSRTTYGSWNAFCALDQ